MMEKYGRKKIFVHPLVVKATGLLIHPAVLSLAVTVIIILLLPGMYPKYLLQETDRVKNYENVFLKFSFLEDDPWSDHILAVNNKIGNAGVAVTMFPSKKAKQWNFHGSFVFPADPPLIIGNYDGDKSCEIYVFTQSNDSIFMHIISNFEDQKKAFTNRFITTVWRREGGYDAYLIPLEMDDLNEDGYKELMFGINTGHSCYPRKIFGYDIRHDSLYQSPQNLFTALYILQADITGDGRYEYFPYGNASDNLDPVRFKYHDTSSWLMALGRNLEFLFEPVELPGLHSSISLLSLSGKEPADRVYGIFLPPAKTNRSPVLFTFNEQGKLLDSAIMPAANLGMAGKEFSIEHNNERLIIYTQSEDSVLVFDGSLHLKKVLNPGFLSYKPLTFDLNEDGRTEWVFFNFRKDQLIVTQELYRHPSVANVEFKDLSHVTASVIYKPGTSQILLINTPGFHYYFRYYANPMYWWQYALYGGIWAGLFSFAFVIRRIQRRQLERRFRAERKITELQLKIARNQMDPHFAMNAINSTVNALEQNRSDAASQHLYHFSRLYRHLVLMADRITSTLGEELEFTENYVKMEQFRFNNSFRYETIISPDIDLKMSVPKMAIQNFVENAIRHGLRKVNNGLLNISISKQNTNLMILITDNGIGRAEVARQEKTSTGMGTRVMKEFFELYSKTTGQEVSFTIEDLFDDEGKAKGTRVMVLVRAE